MNDSMLTVEKTNDPLEKHIALLVEPNLTPAEERLCALARLLTGSTPQEFDKRCALHPIACVEYFAAKDKRDALQKAMKKAATHLDPATGRLSFVQLEYYGGVKTRADAERVVTSLALEYAAYYRQIDLVKFLVETRLTGVMTGALFAAVCNCDLEMTRFLLEKGAIQTGAMLEYSAKNNNFQMVKLLVEYEASEWAYGQRGAREGGHIELRKFFSRKLAGMDATLDGC